MYSDGTNGGAGRQPINISGMPEPKAAEPALAVAQEAPAKVAKPLMDDKVGDFRFSFEYYYAHIMRPFRSHVVRALDLIEPLDLSSSQAYRDAERYECRSGWGS